MSSVLEENKALSKVTYLGMGWNLGLSALKLVAGYLSGSLGLVADGFHSLSDMVSDVIVLLGSWFGAKPPDENHPYGHGKFETMAAMLIAIILIVVGVLIIKDGFEKIFDSREGHVQSVYVIIIAIISIGVKEYLFRITRKIGERIKSSSLNANAWHHRTDALSSAVALIGGIAGVFGFMIGDLIAGIIVGKMIVIVGIKLGYDAIMDLSEASPGGKIEKQLNELIAECGDVRGWHRLRVRRIGRELEMDVHVLLDPNLTIEKGHRIVKKIETAIQEGIDWRINPIIHIDPDTDDIRRESEKRNDAVIR